MEHINCPGRAKIVNPTSALVDLSLAVHTWDTPGDSMRERTMTPPKLGRREMSPPVRAIEHGSALCMDSLPLNPPPNVRVKNGETNLLP